ncbi:hypothetical protein BGZ51_002640 [Haplosporangium sp. Z 767]|nr:hypothetical protein BGZ51_002640 [Haplosporangium sp. Z 767]KAF9185775.1 hypothetical protein BGZ50_002859 [Haplosporangium sp. Z 11]
MALEVYTLLSTRMGKLAFERLQFTTSWVEGFKKFWGHQHYEMKGEASSVDWSKIAGELEDIKSVLSNYSLDNIYNCDEIDLFLQSTSNWTLDKEKRTGIKPSTSRISILFCTNASGSGKRRLFILSTC